MAPAAPAIKATASAAKRRATPVRAAMRFAIRPVGTFVLAGLVALAAPAAAPAASAPVDAAVPAADTARIDAAVEAFYESRDRQPIWLERKRARPGALALQALLARAEADGLDPDMVERARVGEAIEDSRRTWGATLRDDKVLSRAFLRYLHALHRPEPGVDVHHVDAVLAPRPPDPAAVLAGAAAAPSLPDYVARTARMNPLYERLRAAFASAPEGPGRAVLRANMARLRAIPPRPGARFVLVDTASARLWMYEGGRPVGSMKVVVGKPGMETPLMTGLIRFVALKPYWNLPPDLVRDSYAPKAVREGWRSITAQRFEVLDGWGEDAKTVHPRNIDWQAVADGRERVRVRQLPGKGNMMGDMKFMFPNRLGVYLHDTPGRWAFKEDERRFSAGCVRLEDAAALLKWAFAGKPPKLPRAARERAVDLPAPIPVYITYLTARPDRNGRIVFAPDVERRDAQLLAARR